MDACAPREFSLTGGSNPGRYALQGNNFTDFVLETPVRGVIPNALMQLLHFENTFGDTYSSEYCLAAMLNQVLTKTRNPGPDTGRPAHLAETADAACQPAEKNARPDGAACCKVAEGLQRAG